MFPLQRMKSERVLLKCLSAFIPLVPGASFMILNAPFWPVMLTIFFIVGIMVVFGILFLGQAKFDRTRGKSYGDHSNK